MDVDYEYGKANNEYIIINLLFWQFLIWNKILLQHILIYIFFLFSDLKNFETSKQVNVWFELTYLVSHKLDTHGLSLVRHVLNSYLNLRKTERKKERKKERKNERWRLRM
jgi:hypothetical protein